MSCLCAVVEAVSAFAGFAAEGEEIKLVAIGVLTMGTDSFEVFVHGGEGLGFGRWGGSRRGRHDEWARLRYLTWVDLVVAAVQAAGLRQLIAIDGGCVRQVEITRTPRYLT